MLRDYFTDTLIPHQILPELCDLHGLPIAEAQLRTMDESQLERLKEKIAQLERQALRGQVSQERIAKALGFSLFVLWATCSFAFFKADFDWIVSAAQNFSLRINSLWLFSNADLMVYVPVLLVVIAFAYFLGWLHTKLAELLDRRTWRNYNRRNWW